MTQTQLSTDDRETIVYALSLAIDESTAATKSGLRDLRDRVRHGGVRVALDFPAEDQHVSLYPCPEQGAWYADRCDHVLGRHGGAIGTLYCPMNRDGSPDVENLGEIECTYEEASGS